MHSSVHLSSGSSSKQGRTGSSNMGRRFGSEKAPKPWASFKLVQSFKKLVKIVRNASWQPPPSHPGQSAPTTEEDGDGVSKVTGEMAAPGPLAPSHPRAPPGLADLPAPSGMLNGPSDR